MTRFLSALAYLVGVEATPVELGEVVPLHNTNIDDSAEKHSALEFSTPEEAKPSAGPWSWLSDIFGSRHPLRIQDANDREEEEEEEEEDHAVRRGL